MTKEKMFLVLSPVCEKTTQLTSDNFLKNQKGGDEVGAADLLYHHFRWAFLNTYVDELGISFTKQITGAEYLRLLTTAACRTTA